MFPIVIDGVHLGDVIIGQFQFKDRRKGSLTAGKIALPEDLVGYVAIALSKMTVEAALRFSEQQRRFPRMP